MTAATITTATATGAATPRQTNQRRNETSAHKLGAE
jgi:hypothetical protein